MIFKKLILKNFKSHTNSEIDFKKGTTIILGDNGAGKSSIFEGINFALYKKYNTKSLNDLVNTQADKMSVTLHFLVGQQEYKIKRERTKSKSTAQLFSYSNNEYQLIVSGDKDVNAHVELLLETDADLFLNAIYIRQGEIDSLVTQKASDRKKNISKLLRLENLEKAYKDIASVISAYELKKDRIAATIDDDIKNDKDTLIHNKKELQKQLDIKNTELSELNKDISSNSHAIKEQNAANVIFQKLNNDKTRLDTELYSLKNNLQDLNKKIDDFSKYEAIINDSIDFDESLRLCQKLLDLNKEYQSLLKTQALAKEDIKKQLEPLFVLNDIASVYNFEKIIDETHINDNFKQLEDCVQTDYHQSELAFQDILNKEKELMSDINVLNNIISSNQKSLENLKDVEGVCPVCQSSVDDEHKNRLIVNYQQMLIEEQDKLDKRNKEFDILQKEKETLKQLKDDKQKFLDSFALAHLSFDLITDKQEKLNKLESEVLNLSQEIKLLCEQLNLKNNNLENEAQLLYNDMTAKHQEYQEAVIILKDKHDIQQEYDKIRKEHDDKNTELDALNHKINELNFDMNILKSLQEKQNSLQAQYYPLVKDIGEIESNIKYCQTQIDVIEEKTKQNEANKIEVQKINDFINFLKTVRELYSKDGVQKNIRLVLKPQIEKYTQEFFNKFDFEYSNIQLSKDYDISLDASNKKRDVSMMSGGEKIAVALSLRLAIAKAITSNTIETILLDEPTTYLDSIRKTEFVNIIQNISLLPQMILITHDNELENAANNIIFVKKNQEQSYIEYAA